MLDAGGEEETPWDDGEAAGGDVPGGRAELLAGRALAFSFCALWWDGSSSESCREVLGQRTRKVLVSLAQTNPRGK